MPACNMTTNSNNKPQWFVMRDLRRPNAKVTAYHLLMQNGVEAFTPMTMQQNSKTGEHELVPIMKWLLFVHATKQEIDHYIIPGNPLIPNLQYIFQRGKSSRFGGMTVKDSEMNYFRMAVAKQEIPVIYRYGDITPEMRGRRVIVTRGDMIGYQGQLQRYTSGSNMRLFVELDGYCLAPIQVSPEDITFLDDATASMTPAAEQAYYTRLSRLVDIINYLRFSTPQDLTALNDTQLAAVQQAYILANEVFEEFHTREYLCVDEVCTNRLKAISQEIHRRANTPVGKISKTNHTPYPTPVQLPWADTMTQLCQSVRYTDTQQHN